MQLYEKLEQEILNRVTPELEAKYFVISEFFIDGKPNGPVLGRVTPDGWGNTADIYALYDERFPETKDFATAVKYYEGKKCFKVFHLTEGLKAIFAHKQIPACTEDDCPELADSLEKWWTAWCEYAQQFCDMEKHREYLTTLANAFEEVLRNH